MSNTNGTISHPASQTVKAHIDGNEVSVTIRKWKMRDRAELRPKIMAIVEKVLEVQGDAAFALAPMLLVAEDEICEICRLSSTMPDGCSFDDLDLDDLIDIAQAVWTTNVMSASGGGLVGKVGTLLAPLMVSPSSAQKTENEQNGQDSASSPDSGDQPPNVSSLN